MTTTQADIVTEVVAKLHVNQGNASQRTHLVGTIGTTDLVLVVGDASQISGGLVEIEDELLWVDTVDQQAGTITVAPYGRGYQGTTAATHVANTQVTAGPRFARSSIAGEVNSVIAQIYPQVFRVVTDTSQTFVSAKVTYPLPADCDFVLAVSAKTVGPSGMYAPIRKFAVDKDADTATYATGRTIDIRDAADPGQTIKVVYMAAPTPLTGPSSTLASTGLAESARDILVWGAAARLLQNEEAMRLDTGTVEQSARDSLVPPGSSTAGSRAMYALFTKRLQEEGDRLRRLHRPTARLAGA